MKFYGDYHTHSRHSDGRQSIEQIIAAAQQKGLREVAITDHGPLVAVIGVKNAGEYEKIAREVREAAGSCSEIQVFTGAEANIRDRRGTLDIPQAVIADLDILIAGMHPYTMPTTLEDGWELFARNSLRHLGKGQREKARNANTKAAVETVNNNKDLDILSHPGLFFTIDVEEVARACIKNQVLFEINCGHEQPDISDIIEANKLGTQFIINSDAHFPESVGNLDYGSRVLDKLEIDPERVANLQEGGGYWRWGKKAKTFTS